MWKKNRKQSPSAPKYAGFTQSTYGSRRPAGLRLWLQLFSSNVATTI
ncbi:hypothetical protein [[Eubacterium] cellulosolvens]